MRFDILRVQATLSTMDLARDLAEQGAVEGMVVVADEQTAGRGRYGHAWYSPPGQSLYVSVILRPPLTPVEAGWITMSAALAMRETLEMTAQRAGAVSISCVSTVKASIRWFNDVILNGRKACGILVESSITASRLDYSVLGIGLNINTLFDDAPPDVRTRATSLRAELGCCFDREHVLQQAMAQLGVRYEQLLQTRQSPAHEYAQFVDTLGFIVDVNTGTEVVSGQATGISDDGALVVRTAGGERRIGFGTVVSQRSFIP